MRYSNNIGTVLNIRKGIPHLLHQIQTLDLEFLDFFLPVAEETVSPSELQQLHTQVEIPITYHYTTSTILASPQTYSFIKEQIFYYIDQADRYGVPVFVIHPPSTRRKIAKTHIKFKDEEWFHHHLDNTVTTVYNESVAYLTQLLYDIESEKKHRNVIIAIENTDHNPQDFDQRIETMATLKEIIEPFHSSKIGMCYDSYKAFTNREELSLTDYGRYISHIQLSDFSVSKNQGHLGLTKGDLPLEDIISQCRDIQYSGHFSLEVSKEEFKESKEFLQEELEV
jgi:sugar phosphate isomerase/epimerase